MIPVTTFAGKKVAVFGLGKSGLLAAGALIAGGADVIVFDDDAKMLADAQAAGLKAQDLRELDWSGVAALVLAPGVPLTHPEPHWAAALAAKAKVEIIGDIELFCRERAKTGRECPLVAITGTNGKSTTTALIAHLIKSAGRDAQMGGNIGVPVLALEGFTPGRAYVLEVSSYQVDLAPSLKPTVGILLNVSEDHLDRHGSMENYAALKALVLACIEPGGTAVIGVDDRYTRAAADRIERAGKKVVRVSVLAPLRDGFYAEGGRILLAAGGKAHAAAQLAGIGSLRGAHNAQNAACAIAACLALGLELPAIQKGLASFPGLAHRMQQVGHKQSVIFVNDSKATNADSAAKALASFTDIFWIAGGKPKTGGITSLAEFFPRIRKAYLIGEAAADFAKTLNESLDGKVPNEINGTLAAAVDAAARDAAASGLKEPVVLLSPACASFDQYPNFEVRGKAFTDLVRAIPGIQPL
jgi:UDP-N-acetylmuramoylalanine--D-glutamate ligase